MSEERAVVTSSGAAVTERAAASVSSIDERRGLRGGVSCVICCGGSAPLTDGSGPTRAYVAPAPITGLPQVVLCGAHWADYKRDWLLLGWCVDHYGQALQHCPEHDREIEPL